MARERDNAQDKAGCSRRRRGDLSAEDWRAWRQVARTVRPLSGDFAAALNARAEAEDAPAYAPPAAAQRAMPAAEISAPMQIGKTAAEKPHLPPAAGRNGADTAAGSAAGRGGGFDSSSYRKLARGRLPIEGRLDLHNYTQQQAHDALLYFVRGAQSQGKRHVLVITGKGLSSGSVGVLRGRVPHWLAQPLFRPYVSAVEPASRAHGGEGAFYVRLRRLALPLARG